MVVKILIDGKDRSYDLSMFENFNEFKNYVKETQKQIDVNKIESILKKNWDEFKKNRTINIQPKGSKISGSENNSAVIDNGGKPSKI